MIFRGACCDTDHCWVVAKVRERLALSELGKCEVERFNVRKPSDLEVGKQYHILY